MNKLQKFKEGLKNLTALQQLKAKTTGSLWGGIGLILALVGMLYNIFQKFSLIQLGFIVFVSTISYTQFIQYIGYRQQLKEIEEYEKLKGLNLI